MADTLTLTGSERDNIQIIGLAGYFSPESVPQFDQLIDNLLRAGKTRIVLDFSACKIVASPGIGSILDNSLKVTEDFRGALAIVGLDQVKKKVFSMAGILEIAPEASGIEEALKLVNR